jgi:RNA polymerase sigma factor (sigma-70 family)
VGRDPLAYPDEAIRRVYAYVAYRIGPGADAEDVVSETIERALRYRDSYDPRRGSPTAWLSGIASRVLADAYMRRTDLVADLVDEASAEDIEAAVHRRLELHDAIRRLDDRSRELLSLRYGADLKAKEIAGVVDMQVNAVEVALHRALTRLRALMSGDEMEPISTERASPSASRG